MTVGPDPKGICCPITLVLHRSKSSYLPLTLVRPDGRGDAEPEDFKLLARVAPLLERAFNITLRLDRLRTRELALDEAVSRLSVGLVLVEDNGRIAFVNEIAEELLRHAGIIRTSGGVSCLTLDPEVQAAVSSSRGRKAVITEFAMKREGQRPLLLTMMPISRNGPYASESGRVSCAIVVGASALADGRRSIGMSKAYGLTPKEELILQAIAAGRTLNEAADSLKITRNTAQTHLRSIFSKTDLHRQSDLIRLAIGTSPLVR